MTKNNKIRVGPTSPAQALVFKRAKEVDFLLLGGSRGGGKSECITQLPLMWKDDPNFTGMYIRTQIGQLTGSGGLVETANKYYPLFGAKFVQKPTAKFTFPSGARLRYQQIANMKDAEKMRGLQASFIAIDEISQLDEASVQFLLTTLRSEANMNSICVGTCNPHKDNWIFNLVSWYLDERGYVDKSKNGVIRYYVVKDGRFIFAESEDWFKDNMPETVTNSHTGEYIPPKKFCFVQLTIFDNPRLLELNPRYLSELQNLPDHEREAQLYGCWFAEAPQTKFFDRKMVRGEVGERVLTHVPLDAQKVRSWDKSATAYDPKLNNTDADFTACTGMAKTSDGRYIIFGNHCPTNYDKYEKVYGKFRLNSGDRDKVMLDQAKHDGYETKVIIARDPAADGKTVYEQMAKKFISEGFMVAPTPSSTKGNKFARFEPFLMACQSGVVYIVESSFEPNTLEMFYRELERFCPDAEGKWRSTRTVKDDLVDSTADAFNALTTSLYIPSFTLPSLTKVNEYNF